MSSSIIIGIHGLRNKPTQPVLEGWWLAAIKEGLQHNLGVERPVPFSLAYWSDLRYSTPIAQTDDDEPYAPFERGYKPKRYKTQMFDKPRVLLHQYGGRMVDLVKDRVELDTFVEAVWGVKCDDLAAYCGHGNDAIRHDIRSRLETLLAAHEDKRILLISHSMGAIVAYDALRTSERRGQTHIEHFVTIGSPLGLPSVHAKMREWFTDLRTPQNVGRWTNIADPSDRVAFDSDLHDEYKPFEGVTVIDKRVHNAYVGLKGPNHHKSYGYLRTPEMSELIREFLAEQT